MKYLVLFMAVALVSCVEQATQDDGADQSSKNAAARYEAILDKYSAGDIEYNGFYHSFGFHAAIINSEVIEANIRRQAQYYMWDKERTDIERDKLFKTAAESTMVFLSFYTPEKKDDNLGSDKSIWRVLLDVGGKRYVGKVKKLKSNFSEMIALYPFHTRWNTAYMVSFPVSTTQAEAQVSKFTITGPMGSRNIDFSAKGQPVENAPK